jgi:REP element-mobilizing transposase RayT
VAPATARTPESTSASEFTQSPKSSTSDTSQDEHGDLNKDKSVVLRNTSFNVASVNDVNPVAANIRPDVHACACSDHPKHLLLDVHLPLHASDVFHLIFGESQYVVRECDRGQLWRRNEHCQWTQRDVLYTRPFEAVRDSSSKRTPITLEHQRMRHYDEVNGVYAVDVWTRFAANQRDDQFVVYTRWCITETMDSQKHAPCTRLLLTCSVEFTRKFVIRENALERSAVDRMRVLVNIFFARLKGHLDHTLPSTLQTIRQLKHSSPIPEIVLSPLMKKKHHRHYHHKKNAKSAVAHTRSLGGQSWTGFNFRVFPSSLGELGGFLTKTTSFFSIILLCLLVFTTVWNAISIVQLHEQDVTHAASIPTLDSSFDATPTTTAKSSIVLSPNSLQKSMHTSEEVASSLDMDKSSDAFEAEKQDNNMQFCQSAELRKMLELYTEFERLKHRRALTPANNDETDTYSTVWMDIAEKLMSVSPTQFENVNDCIKLLKTRDERQSN